MKKIFLVILITLFVVIDTFAGIVITTTVTIGKKSQNCTGFGICSVSSTNSVVMGAINGTIQINDKNGTMIIGLNKADLLNVQPEKQSFFEAANTVVFTEDFVMPDEINTAIKASKSTLIKKGEYSLTLTNGIYYIEIPLYYEEIIK